MATFTPPGIVNLVKEGKLRAGGDDLDALADLPDALPTMKELGIDIEITNWNGFFVPAGTPKPIADKLAAELHDIVLNTDVKGKLRGMFQPIRQDGARADHAPPHLLIVFDVLRGLLRRLADRGGEHAAQLAVDLGVENDVVAARPRACRRSVSACRPARRSRSSW